jgi:hypothetical protein
MRSREPFTASAARAASVAMPQVRWRMLSAVRSPTSSVRSDAETVPTIALPPMRAPSPSGKRTSAAGSSRVKTRAKARVPESTSGSFAQTSARPRAPSGTSAWW